jgi:hypothetical protein
MAMAAYLEAVHPQTASTRKDKLRRELRILRSRYLRAGAAMAAFHRVSASYALFSRAGYSQSLNIRMACSPVFFVAIR